MFFPGSVESLIEKQHLFSFYNNQSYKFGDIIYAKNPIPKK